MATRREAKQQPIGKRKRGRLACVSCRTRKQRCDGAQPRCSYCSQHDIECVFEFASKKAEVSELYVHRILNRVTHLEEELEASRALLSQSSAADRASAEAHSFAPLEESSIDADLLAALSPISTSTTEYGRNSYTAQRASVEVDYGATASNTAADRSGKGRGRLGETSTVAFVNKIIGEQQPELRSGGFNDQHAFRNALFDEQLNTWPQRLAADKLVDCYMEFCYPQYPFIHGPSFRKRYEALWTTKEPLSNNFAGTVNVVFALGSDFSSDMSASMGQVFFQRAKSLIEPTILEAATLDSLQALILLGLYLQSTNNLTHSWNVVGIAVHVAQSLELHKDAAGKELMSPVECETRKRAWWACYLLDSVSCMQLGRPHMISDQEITVDLPACVDDEFLYDSAQFEGPDSRPHPSRQPSSRPSLLSFLVATIQLCRFMRDVHHVYEHAGDQSQFLEIDQRMCDWAGDLPLHLRPNGVSSTDRKLGTQKEVLTSRFLHLRLLLHRPAIVQRMPDNFPGFSPFDSAKPAATARILSLRAETCVGLAVSLIKHISEFYARGLNSAWWYDLNYLFSAAVVLIVHSSSGLAEAQIFEMIQTAIYLIKGLRDRGKTLASSYLRMMEIFYRQISPGDHDAGFIPVTFQDPDLTPFEHVPDSSMQKNTGGGSASWPSFNNINPFLENMSFPWNLSDEFSLEQGNAG